MPQEGRWSPRMHDSWQYALRTVNEGLSGAAGLRALRTGGGEIRTKDWYQLMRWSNEAYNQAEAAEDFWRAIELPESVYAETPFQLREEYKMTAEVRFWNRDTNKYERHWYSVADNQSKSRELWMSALNIAMERYGEFMDLSTVTVTRTMFWHRE